MGSTLKTHPMVKKAKKGRGLKGKPYFLKKFAHTKNWIFYF